jgi:hypothetical protein
MPFSITTFKGFRLAFCVLMLVFIAGCSNHRELSSHEYRFYRSRLKNMDAPQLKALIIDRDKYRKLTEQLEQEVYDLTNANKALTSDLKRSYQTNKKIAMEKGLTASNTMASMDASEVMAELNNETKNSLDLEPTPAPEIPIIKENYLLQGATSVSTKGKLNWITIGTFPTLADAKAQKKLLGQVGMDVHKLKIVTVIVQQ